jgi:hypothetical protein
MADAYAAYLELQPGCYRLAVNSDDGFEFAFGWGLFDVLGLVVSQFDGGRGAATTSFDIAITQAGLYPIRVLWWEGGGGANIEIFSINPDTGIATLINDSSTPGAVKAYRDLGPGIRAQSHLQRVLPVRRMFGGAQADATIIAELVDGQTPIVPSPATIQMTVNGQAVTPTMEKDPLTGVTTLTVAAPAGGYKTGIVTVSVTADGKTHTWSFPIGFPPNVEGLFVIEAEDFNNNGEAQPAASVMPYLGGAYDGLPAVAEVDYHKPDDNSSNLYRIGEEPNNNMDVGPGGQQFNRGAWVVTTSFKLGWVDNGEWCNYTRDFGPERDYCVGAALSFDGRAAGQLAGRLSVLAGNQPDPALPCQTLEDLGTFYSDGSGGWGVHTLVPMRGPQGNIATVRLGGVKTLRFTMGSGDFDFLAFIPAAAVTPPPPPPTTSFYIEAEDFNFGSGQHLPIASTMPYYGGAYQGLGAVQDTDYHNNDGNESDIYRCGESPNVNITGQGLPARDGWDMVANYRIGWIGGDWHNYTRTFPAGDYEVLAALSFDGRAAGQLHGTLQKVADATVPNDPALLTQLGTFDAPGSGGWGLNNLVPLRQADGCTAVVHLDGTETIRYTSDSGDFDYLWFRRAGPVGTLSIRYVNATSVRVIATAPGRLQAADEVTGPWADTGLVAPFDVVIPVDRARRFGRLCR